MSETDHDDDSPTGGSAPRPHIAVALSGGGHRAALFGLGALLYLVDAGKGPELATISSVSGLTTKTLPLTLASSPRQTTCRRLLASLPIDIGA